MTKKARANMTVVESVPVREFLIPSKSPWSSSWLPVRGGWIE